MPITKVYSNLAKSSAINYPLGPSSRLPLKLFFDFLGDPLTVLHNLSKEYGDISYFKFGKHYIYLINNPDYIKNVLVDQENNYINSRGLQLAKRILGEGLLTSEGELHHRQRQLIQPVFQPDEITSYANIHGNQPWFDHFSWIWHINNDNISMDSSTYLGCTSCSDTTWNYSLPSKKHTESAARE